MIGLSNGDEYGMATIDLDDGYIATVEFIDLQDDSLKTENTDDKRGHYLIIKFKKGVLFCCVK